MHMSRSPVFWFVLSLKPMLGMCVGMVLIACFTDTRLSAGQGFLLYGLLWTASFARWWNRVYVPATSPARDLASDGDQCEARRPPTRPSPSEQADDGAPRQGGRR